MSSPGLPLSPIVDVTVEVSPSLGVPPPLNQGLVIGGSTGIIPHATRLVQFESTTAMLTYGFSNTDPEYLAALLYFGQSPPAQSLWVGFQDPTSLATIIPHSGNAGTGYVVGDVITVTQSGGSGGQAEVTAIGGGGAVTTLVVQTFADGTGYSVASGLSTTGGSGTGLEVDISAVGESAVVAVENCRVASTQWYACMVCGTAAADHIAIAAYVESEDITQPTFYFGNTQDAAVLTNSSGNVAATLKASEYSRTALSYSTTQSGAAPNNAYAAAAIMGVEMGLNTGLPSFYFTMMFKQLVGVIPEPLSQSQINTIQANNCNLYVGYVNQYTIFQTGITPSGVYIDQTLNRDILRLNIQYNVMNLLVSSLSVPQTDPGETQLIHAVNEACATAVTSGYLAPGTYQGTVPILNLQPPTASGPGSPMPAGYVTQAQPYSLQTPAAKQARQAMPITCVVNEAGAVQSLVVGVIVNP